MITARIAASLHTIVLTTIVGLTACSNNDQPQTRFLETDAPLKKLELRREPAPEGARVFFISPADGDVVSSPVKLEFGAKNLIITLTGDYKPNSGHHHLLINTPLPPEDDIMGPEEGIMHFNKAETGVELELEPGVYTLQLLAGDGNHVAHEPPILSEKITITVE